MLKEAKENILTSQDNPKNKPNSKKKDLVINRVSSQKLTGKRIGKGDNKYCLGNFIGKGGFAKCFEAYREIDNTLFAAKVVSLTTITDFRTKQKLISEINIHKSLNHPNIVRYCHHYQDSENVYILLDYCSNKSLYELLKSRKYLTEQEVRYYMFQIISSIEYLHDRNIVHRDLKLANFFLDEKLNIKLGDFGLAAFLEEGEKRKTLCGTPNYIAPEILERIGHGYEVDIWSLGVVFYTLLFGKPPFESTSVNQTCKLIKNNQYSLPYDHNISKSAIDLIQKVLHLDPNSRCSLKDILSHSFFMENNIPKTVPLNSLREEPNLSEALSNFNVLIYQCIDLLKNVFMADEVSAYTDSNLKLLWVSRWLDYTVKYGLGYELIDGSFGILYNDATKLFKIPNIDIYEYTSENGTKVIKSDIVSQDMKKKKAILKLFSDYIEEKLKKNILVNPSFINDSNSTLKFNFIKVNHWKKVGDLICFVFSNSTIQFNFPDHNKILVDLISKNITFLQFDVNRQISFFQYDLRKSLYLKKDFYSYIIAIKNCIIP